MERNTLALWITLTVAGLITYLIRLSFIFLLGRWQPSRLVERALRFVPPAVLSAIILPEIFFQSDTVNFSPVNPRLIAGLAAALTAWLTRSMLLTIAVGMGVLVLLQILGL